MAGYVKEKTDKLVAGLISNIIKKYYGIDISKDAKKDIAEKISDLIKTCRSN